MKKLIVFIMILVTVLSVFVGCKKEHTHVFADWSVTKNATCQEDGTKTRYCDCGEKQTEVIPKVEHKFENNVCVYCGIKHSSSSCDHENLEAVVGRKSTCTTKGLSDGVKCTDCGVMVTEQKELPLAFHIAEFIDGKEATCTEKGLTKGIRCEVCHEVLEAQEEIPVVAHTEAKLDGYASTCKVAGRSDGVECSVCHTVLVEQTELPLAKHTYDDDYDATCNVCGKLRDVACTHATIICIERVDPTCTSKGLTEGMYCEDCGETLLEQQVIDVLPHTPIIVTGINATCYSTGLTDGKMCINCGLVIVAQTVIDKTAHTPGAAVRENEIAATCLSEGSYDEVIYCSVGACGALISRTSKTTPKTTHKYVNGVCEICGDGSIAGLYDKDGNMIVTWSELVNTYGMDVENDYSYNDYESNPAHPTYVLSHNEQLKLGTKLIIDGTVANIGKYAFIYCEFLTDVEILDGVTKIGVGVFECCKNLRNVTLPNGIIMIDEYAFCGCYNLSKVEIPDSVMYIEQFAFCNCDSLVSIDLPSRLSIIYSSAFSECDSLEYVNIPNSTSMIQGESFDRCTSLKTVVIPKGVSKISSRAFYGCSSLTEFVVDSANKNYKSIDGNLYTADGKTLLQYAIGKRDSKFAVPTGVEKIGDYAFSSSTRLIYVEIPNTVVDIGYGAFAECRYLASVNIPNGITTIKRSTFSYCYALTLIEIPSSVTSIEYDAFQTCKSLYKVINNSNVTLSFNSTHSSGILSSAKVLVNRNGACTYREITNGSYFETSDGYLFEQKSGEYNLLAYYGESDTVTLPADINGNRYSIYKMRGVKNVIIPEGITEIDMYAFRECSTLVSIRIPASVTLVNPNEPFYDCISLMEITVADGNQNYMSIDGNLYTKDGKTLIQYAPGKTDSSFIIPNGVTSIDYFSFACANNLTSLVIPKSVVEIDYNAFYYALNITDIYYCGTEKEWEDIKIGSGNESLTSATIHYNYVPEN